MSHRELSEVHERPASATTVRISVSVVGHVSSRPLVCTPLWQVPPIPLHTSSQLMPPAAAAFQRTWTAGGGVGGVGGGDSSDGAMPQTRWLSVPAWPPAPPMTPLSMRN